MIATLNKIPDTSIINKNFGKIDYQDSYEFQVSSDVSVDKLATEIFSTSPKWADFLMKLRDNIVKLFGLQTSEGINKNVEPFYSIGSRAVVFTVIDRNDNELVMGEDDKHLNFRTSVLIEKNTDRIRAYLSTIVHYNNVFGRLYFMPVRPFHRFLMKSILKRVQEKKDYTD